MNSTAINDGLMHSRISVPATLAFVFTLATWSTLRYFYGDIGSYDVESLPLLARLLSNNFCIIILAIFSGGLLFALLQFIGLQVDSGALIGSLYCFVSGRSAGATHLQDTNGMMTGDQVLELLTLRRQREFLPLQYIIWVLPMLGFIGTVWGIASSIGGLTGLVGGQRGGSENVQAVLSGLQFAFDTTLLGLVGSVPLMLILAALRSHAIQMDAKLVTHLWQGASKNST